MSLCTRILLSLAVGQLLTTVGAVPSFDIDLDAPPEKRWQKVAAHYKTHLIGMAKSLKPQLRVREPWTWSKTVHYSPQIVAEMQGMVNTINDPEVTLDMLKQMNVLYEMESPTACAGVLWAMPNGTVMQGRNMDYGLHFKMPDGQIMNWPDVTFHATFHKGGSRLFESTQWPGVMGIHTGMRFGGWSFQQNTRLSKNDYKKNLQAAKKGGKPFMTFAREVMETTPDFKDAVKKMSTAEFIAPQYFIMSGTGPFEGVVITRDRLGEHDPSTPSIQHLSKEEPGWHLLQTNDDITGEPGDVRRPLANMMLNKASQEITTVQHLAEFMHSSPLKWKGTVFTTVMVPSFDYYSTALPNEPPGPIDQALFSKEEPEEKGRPMDELQNRVTPVEQPRSAPEQLQSELAAAISPFAAEFAAISKSNKKESFLQLRGFLAPSS